MTTKKPRIFKQAGWWRVSHWSKSHADLDNFVRANNFVSRLNNRIADKRCDEFHFDIKPLTFGKVQADVTKVLGPRLSVFLPKEYKRGGLCP